MYSRPARTVAPHALLRVSKFFSRGLREVRSASSGLLALPLPKMLFRKLMAEPLERRLVMDAAAFVSLMSEDQIWQTTSEIPDVEGKTAYIQPRAFTALTLDTVRLKEQLAQAPLEFTPQAQSSPLELTLPTPNNSLARFRVVSSPIMEPALAAEFPELQTFAGQGIDDPAATLRFDITPAGFHAQVLSPSGTYYIDPYYHLDDRFYISYFRSDLIRTADRTLVEAELETEDQQLAGEHLDTKKAQFQVPPSPLESTHSHFNAPGLFKDADGPMLQRAGAQLRTYRLANAATGEYVAFHGGTVALGQAAIVTAINRVTGIYENELSVRLVLVANNSSLVYTNATTDPYTNTNGSTMLGQNQTNVDTVIGNANYDIGHVFSTGGGGIAGLGVVGVTGQKARGVTGLGAPIGDAFYVDYVAHEMGHQFGGSHTFNSSSGSCNGNRSAGAAYEPGSGSTIQAYAGICGVDNLQSFSDPYFHSYSFDQIAAYVTTGNGNAAAAITNTGNSVPRINAGPDYVIPSRTPFTLSAAGADANTSDVLTYNWEQRDLGPSTTLAAADNGTSPLFRSFNPTTSPERTLPRLAELLNNTTPVGEKLPTLSRTMRFRATVRDNRSGGGGLNTDDVALTVVDTGAAFAVTSPNTAVNWTSGSTQTLTWNVAGTTASPINTSTVNVWLSVDGGQNFTVLLAADTPNDGSHSITVPALSSSQARIKVEAGNSIYFDVSDTDFTITGNANSAPTISSITNRLVDAGSSTGPIGFTIADAQTAPENLVVTATTSDASMLPPGSVGLGGSGANRTLTLTPAPGQFGVATISVNVTDQAGATTTRTFKLFVEAVFVCTPFQNFDSVTAPLLPAGWISAATGTTPVNWSTSAATSDSAPNNALVTNPTNISDSTLTSPAYVVSQASRRIQFRNNFNLETGYDGGVLEISIDGGSFTDLITAGGLFISGGYTSSLSTAFANPIGGRSAWTGNSGGYITTVAELPAAALGRSVRLRFRMASDNSDAAVGWRVDTIQTCGVDIPSVISITAVDAQKPEGNSGVTPFTFTVSRTGDPFAQASVDYAVTGSGINPAGASDFGAAFPSGTVSFAVNEMSKTLTINVLGDTTVEPDEGFTVTLNNPTGNSSIAIATATGLIINDELNSAPQVTSDLPNVIGNVLGTISNSGTWTDADSDEVSLSASLGTVVKNSNGTWNWSLIPTASLSDVVVTITASDGTNQATTTFTVSALVNIVSTGVYYKGSSFANNGIAAATAPNKLPARAGSAPVTLSYDNLINTTRGINGLVINAAGLSATSLSLSDFTFRMSPQGLFNEAANPPSSWASAPAPQAIFVTAGSGSTPAQVRLEWADGVILNRWLQVRVLANANTGLPTTETYYLGHLTGELNGQLIAGGYFVSNADLTQINPIGGVATVGNNRDVDKNGFVLNSDGLIVRNAVNASLSLRNITIPPAASAGEFRTPEHLKVDALPSDWSTLATPTPVVPNPALAVWSTATEVTATGLQAFDARGTTSTQAVIDGLNRTGSRAAPSHHVTESLPAVAQRLAAIDNYFDSYFAQLSGSSLTQRVTNSQPDA